VVNIRTIFPLWLLLVLQPALAATLQVSAGDGAIAAALHQARPGDTLLLAPGHYRENLHIDKAVTLQAAKPQQRPVVDGSGQGDVIRITAPGVVLRQLIITDSGSDLTAQNAGVYVYPGSDGARIEGCDIAYSLFGLWIEKSNDVTVNHNLITGKRDLQSSQRGNGIELYNTTGAHIEGNHISYARDGIYVDVSHHASFIGNRIHNVRYGTHYMNSYYNVWENNEAYHNRSGLALMETRNQIVRGNRAWGNSDHGIMLRTIQDSVIENNIVAGNQRGFFIYDAEYNVLRNNLVVDNAVGAHLWAGSYRNQVSGNDFIHNREQIRYVASRDVPWPGNFWSNYAGWDRKGKGIGEVPYAANDVVDRLMWRLPAIRMLMGSPAIQTLRLIAQQFPLLRAPSVVDEQPHMHPLHQGWEQWLGKSND